jgi:hypothetical protein
LDSRALTELNVWAEAHRAPLHDLRPSELERLAAPFPPSRGGEPGLAALVEARRRFHLDDY